MQQILLMSKIVLFKVYTTNLKVQDDHLCHRRFFGTTCTFVLTWAVLTNLIQLLLLTTGCLLQIGNLKRVPPAKKESGFTVYSPNAKVDEKEITTP